jgi:hypothetical protein
MRVPPVDPIGYIMLFVGGVSALVVGFVLLCALVQPLLYRTRSEGHVVECTFSHQVVDDDIGTTSYYTVTVAWDDETAGEEKSKDGFRNNEQIHNQQQRHKKTFNSPRAIGRPMAVYTGHRCCVAAVWITDDEENESCNRCMAYTVFSFGTVGLLGYLLTLHPLVSDEMRSRLVFTMCMAFLALMCLLCLVAVIMNDSLERRLHRHRLRGLSRVLESEMSTFSLPP